jgi:hypothetical protein
MSLGISTAFRAKQTNQKHCDICELYYLESLDKCDHCSELNTLQLVTFKAQHQEVCQSNSAFGKHLLFYAMIIGLLLLLSFL